MNILFQINQPYIVICNHTDKVNMYNLNRKNIY